MFDLAAQLYLKPRPDSFWRWSERGNVVCWRDGTTIAFRQELLAVLEPLAAIGLPPLEGVLLLLAATQSSWPDQSFHLLESMGEETVDLGFAERLDQLARINKLDESRRSLEAKITLVSLVFEDGRRIGPKVSQQVLVDLEHGLDEETLAEPDESINIVSISRAIGWLTGLERVDPESLPLRQETGLDELPAAIPLELSPAERIRLLVKDLDDDEELSGVARLARNLMAAVTLPRRISQHEDLPLGGVSDITNRGSLDRLLLSELAHDDTTLAVRVAVGEALYLRRESPPRSPPRARVMLLECGVRSWGIPRVFSTAVALALGATADAESELFVYRAEADQLEPVDLTSRDGLVEHLSILRPEAHPGASLAAFAQQLEELGEAIEPLLVTTEDVLADPEFVQLLNQHCGPLLLALVDRTGQLRLLERSPQGSKPIRIARFDVEELLEQRRRKRLPLVDESRVHELPAIFAMDPFPLRFSVQPRPGSFWNLHGHVIGITRDQRLVRWIASDLGAEEIAQSLPRGELLWSSGWSERGIARAVVGRPTGELRLLIINLSTRTVRSVRLALADGDEFRRVAYHNGGLFVIRQNRIEVFDREGTPVGDDAQAKKLAHQVWSRHGRFFQDMLDHHWLALSFDGQQARLEPVMSGQSHLRAPELLQLFDWVPRQAIWGITKRGTLFDTLKGDEFNVPHGLQDDLTIMGISPDGMQYVLRESNTHAKVLVDVASRTAKSIKHYSSSLFDTKPLFHITQRTVRSRLLAIRRCGERIQILSRNRQWHEFTYFAARDAIKLVRLASVEAGKAVEFKPHEHSSVNGFSLSVAPLADGACAFMDSRGLLHLKSNDRSLPELTLVLRDQHISGWSARDSGMFGEMFFIGRNTSTVSSREIYGTLARYARLLPDS